MPAVRTPTSASSAASTIGAGKSRSKAGGQASVQKPPRLFPNTKPVKPGSNWSKLRKSLPTNGFAQAEALRKKRRLSSAQMSELSRISSPEASSSRNAFGSPVPTTLPWFAEDLDPEDLEMVRRSHADPSALLDKGKTPLKGSGVMSDEALKMQVILGGNSKDSEGKREVGQYLALDCEMVGVGAQGSESVLARVSVVNWHGHCVLDTFVKPKEAVTDYRTWVSGVRAANLKNAPSFEEVQERVSKLIHGRVLIGHAVHNDLSALLLDHPRRDIRDTAKFQPLRDLAKSKYPGLRKLASLVLGIDIQKAGRSHSSIEDAQATMAIYRTQHSAWQKSLGRNVPTSWEVEEEADEELADTTADGAEPPRVASAQHSSKPLKKPANIIQPRPRKPSATSNRPAQARAKHTAAPGWWNE
ncbi:rna exonuclease 4 [Ceraceosorus bombacis]|uniref:RNA exonuclease 4 n=1 Tax=Ceraceosorus bombacis TaxID=401625 RepID=A0A0P1BJ07_9BASI|nr:rna exonuclease 4 [Ceraceosorus bombacis]